MALTANEGVEETDLTLFRGGGGGGLADVTNVFFLFKQKGFPPFFRKQET